MWYESPVLRQKSTRLRSVDFAFLASRGKQSISSQGEGMGLGWIYGWQKVQHVKTQSSRDMRTRLGPPAGHPKLKKLLDQHSEMLLPVNAPGCRVYRYVVIQCRVPSAAFRGFAGEICRTIERNKAIDAVPTEIMRFQASLRYRYARRRSWANRRLGIRHA